MSERIRLIDLLFLFIRNFRIFKNLLNRSMNAHYRTLAEYILREITLQQNHSPTFMKKVDDFSLLVDHKQSDFVISLSLSRFSMLMQLS